MKTKIKVFRVFLFSVEVACKSNTFVATVSLIQTSGTEIIHIFPESLLRALLGVTVTWIFTGWHQ